MKNVREIALSLLLKWESEGEYINLTLGGVTNTLSDGDRRRLTALLYGTVERKITLDYWIATLTRGKTLTSTARNLLRMGLYELTFMHTPAHAVVNETVSLSAHRGEAALINGVLRRAVREPDSLTYPPREKNEARYLSVCYSVPQPTVKRLREVLGDGTEDFLIAVNRRAPLTLRVNTLKIDRETFLARLREAGISAAPTKWAPCGVTLTDDRPVREIPGFEAGWFFVQDEASQISTAVLDPQAGETVLDVCACPGGKSFGAAITMGNVGKVHAYDLHASKLSLITDGARRLGIGSLTAEAHDACESMPEWVDRADRVICDVPCSGLGVLGKKADLRYKDPAVMDTLPPLQTAILETVSQYVKVGGTLLYSTCTVNPRENRAVVDAFLAAHPTYVLVPFSCGSLSAPDGDLTLYPHTHATDGFYIANLERRAHD